MTTPYSLYFAVVRNCILFPLSVLLFLLQLPAHGQTRTWVGPATGVWTTADNWSDAEIPDTASEDVVIDGSSGQDSAVTYTLAIGTVAQIGSLTLDAGDSLTLNKSTAQGSASITINGNLHNAGTLTTGGSSAGSAHGHNFTVTVTGAGATFNTGTMNVRSLGSFRRSGTTFNIPGNNTNAGALNVINVSTQGGSYIRNSLTGTGAVTFTNNGTVSILGNGTDSTAGGSQPWAIFGPSASNTSLTLSGTGTLNLASNNATTGARSDSFAILSGTTGSMTGLSLTNAVSHTIAGNGRIGHAGNNNGGSGNTISVSSFASITNDGLIKAARGVNFSSLQILGGSATITNSSMGRMISADGNDAGSRLEIGAAGSTFVNHGLLEARTGNSIVIAATNVTLNGTIAGGGSSESSLALSDLAVFSPGDLDNGTATPDGTGISTIGIFSVTGDLSFSNSTSLNFQLGNNALAGADYDSAFASGSLTLDGVLNVTSESGFGTGAYRLLSFGAGQLTDNTLSLGIMPGGYNYTIDANNAVGYVDLVVSPVPEMQTGLLLLLGSMLIWTTRRTRSDAKLWGIRHRARQRTVLFT